MDITNVKNMLGITTDKHDLYLSEMLPIMLEFAADYCNNTFAEPYPAGVKLFVAKGLEFNMGSSTLKSRTMGEVSYTYETEFPKSVMKHLAPYRKVRFHA